MGDRREQGDRATVQDTEKRGACGPDGIHHRQHVVHVLGQRRIAAGTIGHSSSSLVEQDQPAAGGQPSIQMRERRVFPADLQVPGEAGDEHQVDRPGSEYLVGQGRPAVTREAGERQVRTCGVVGQCFAADGEAGIMTEHPAVEVGQHAAGVDAQLLP